MAIPRILHQTAPSLEGLPAEIRRNVERIRAANPGWEYRFYDDAHVLACIDQHLGPRIVDLCRRLHPRYRVVTADLVRYLAVYHEGGVYLDCKSFLARPLDDVLRPDDSYVISQWQNQAGAPAEGWGLHRDLIRIPGGEFQQWHVIASARHPFLAHVIEQVVFNLEHYNPAWYGVGLHGVLRVSGPICYSLSIAPMLALHRYRLVDIERLGFHYTIYDRITQHQDPQQHYSTCREPLLTTLSRGGEARAGHAQPAGKAGQVRQEQPVEQPQRRER